MIKWGLNKKFLLPLAAAGAFFVSTSLALAVDEITPTLSVGGNNERGGAATTQKEDSKSFLREWTFENSFDKAGDANENLEKSIGTRVDYKCEQYREGATLDGKQILPNPTVYADCVRRQREANHFKADVASIKKTQRIFAEVSRVSDVAAVAAIGAAGYAEFGQKKANMSNTYEQAAKLQETAAMAAYTTGAADVSMGAWAFAMQKRKLEAMQETLNGKGASGISGNSGNSSLNSRLSSAIEQTKEAAYKHMAWGAGKVAAGYAGMKLAKRSREQADNMKSIEVSNAYLASLQQQSATAPRAATAADAGSPAATAATNQPSFAVATDADYGKSTSTVTATNSGSAASSTGSSSMFGDREFKSGISKREPASSASPGGGAPAAMAGGGPEAPKEGEAEEKAAEEAVAKTAFGYGEFSRGGGGASFSGSSSGSSSSNPVEDVAAGLSNLLGGGDAATPSVASQINPYDLADDANAGVEGNEQGSMVGVSGNRNVSLFDTIKLKHNKALQVGNVQGPGLVEVRN